jgi:hypothetical protein
MLGNVNKSIAFKTWRFLHVMDPQVFRRLEKIRDELKEQHSDLVDINCYGSALRVRDELGLQAVEGFYKDEFGRKMKHCWNYDPESREIVDLTAGQFESALPKILIIPEDSEAAKNMYENVRVVSDPDCQF